MQRSSQVCGAVGARPEMGQRDGRMYKCTCVRVTVRTPPYTHGQNDVVVWSLDEAYPKQVKDGENGKIEGGNLRRRRRAAEKDGDSICWGIPGVGFAGFWY